MWNLSNDIKVTTGLGDESVGGGSRENFFHVWGRTQGETIWQDRLLDLDAVDRLIAEMERAGQLPELVEDAKKNRRVFADVLAGRVE
jgi:hypothetical protein